MPKGKNRKEEAHKNDKRKERTKVYNKNNTKKEKNERGKNKMYSNIFITQDMKVNQLVKISSLVYCSNNMTYMRYTVYKKKLHTVI